MSDLFYLFYFFFIFWERADLGESQYDSIGFGDRLTQVQDHGIWPCSSHLTRGLLQ